MQNPQNQNREREDDDDGAEAEAEAALAARAFRNMPDDVKELVTSNMDKMPKNGQVCCGSAIINHVLLSLLVQVTVLLFRDGAQLNLFHVLEKPDGSYTPLSDSWSGSSLRNLFASSGIVFILLCKLIMLDV